MSEPPIKVPAVKFCGMTRAVDIECASELAVNAIGLVFYPKSSRYVDVKHARSLMKSVPPFMTIVALFVNPTQHEVEQVLQRVNPHLLQFHGDEDEGFCQKFNTPYLKALRMQTRHSAPHIASQSASQSPDAKLIYSSAKGLLYDAYDAKQYGGTGHSFNWDWFPPTSNRTHYSILAGGLNPDNISQALMYYPDAVDVSGGIESSPGIKDPIKMRLFMERIRNAIKI